MSHSRDDPASTPADLAISQLDDFGNLVLSRLIGESVIISIGGVPVARISVADIRSGGKVRLACECPPSIDIDREVIYCEKLNENQKLSLTQKETIRTWVTNNKNRR